MIFLFVSFPIRNYPGIETIYPVAAFDETTMEEWQEIRERPKVLPENVYKQYEWNSNNPEQRT